jgi:putative DNA primase/helicase
VWDETSSTWISSLGTNSKAMGFIWSAGYMRGEIAEMDERPITASLVEQLRVLKSTNAGNGEAFALLHGERFRYEHSKGRWLVWNGLYWAEDNDGEADRAALDTARQRLSAAAFIKHSQDQDIAVKWALRSESVHGRKATLISARSIRVLATTTPNYDRDPFLLTVGNGTVNLRTGTLREARREDLITRASSVPYLSTAGAPRWEQFLKEIFGEDPAMRSYIQRAVGYSLTGDTREQCFFLLCGSGANGKTTFLETIIQVLGTHAVTAAFSTFVAQPNHSGPRNDLAALCGARFVKAAEVAQRARMDEVVMKQLTGEDTISTRYLYREEFQFKPQAKVWLASNTRLSIWETSEAIWRRIKLIEFNRQFTGRQADSTLRGKLEAELPGVLAWAVRGCLEWQKVGLNEPQRVSRAVSDYRQESDQVGRYLEQRCHLVPGSRTPAKKLYGDYVQWCVQQSEKPVTVAQFAGKLNQRQLERKRSSGGIVYHGVELLPAVALSDTKSRPTSKGRRK